MGHRWVRLVDSSGQLCVETSMPHNPPMDSIDRVCVCVCGVIEELRSTIIFIPEQ